MGTALVFLLLLALCGFIAYTGDLLGRRLGKKRLSVFGLRPKHTAVLLTVVTGIVIAGVTFGAAMATVPPFRGAVLHGEKLAVQNQRLRDRNRALDETIRSRIRDSRDLEERNRELSTVNGRLQAESGRLTAENRKLVEESRKLARQSELLRTQNGQLQTESRRIAASNRQLHRASAEFAAKNRQLAGKNEALLRKNRDLQSEQRRLAEQVEELRDLASSYRSQRFNFRKEELIGQRVIPPNPPERLLRDTVTALLFEVEREAEQRGAKPGYGRGTRVYLVPPRNYSGVGTPEALREATIQRAAAIRDKPLVLRVRAGDNTLPGRPLAVVLECASNEVVVRRGDVIAYRPVDGGASEGLILGDLIQFLRTDVRANAQLLLDIGEEEAGEMTYDQLLDVTRRIRRIGGTVQVLARARQDTLRAGPLSIDLEVRSLAAARAEGGG